MSGSHTVSNDEPAPAVRGEVRQIERPVDGSRRRVAYPRFIAARLLRARRQGILSLISVLSALGFLVGAASLIVALALMTGFQDEVFATILDANPHLTVFPAGGSLLIDEPERVARKLETIEGIEAAEPVIYGAAALSGATEQIQGAQILALPAERAHRVTSIPDEIVEGSFEALGRPTGSGRPGIVVGTDLAQRLGVLPGDQVRVLVPKPKLTPWGMTVRQRVLEVVGIFSTGFFQIDSSWSLISFDQAQELLGADGAAHWIAGRVEKIEQLDEIKQEIIGVLGTSFLPNDVLSQNRPLFSALRLEKLMIFLAVGLIVLVAALGVVSTLVLTVTQRRREIGVLVALGASPGGVLRIFVLQGLTMGVLGTVLGCLLGVGVCWWLDTFQVVSLDPEVYYLDHLPFTVRAGDLASIAAVAVLVAALATLYPSWRAARLDPVEALRR